MANHNGHWDERADREAHNNRNDNRNDQGQGQLGSMSGRDERGSDRQSHFGTVDRGRDGSRYDRAFDRIPERGHDEHRATAPGYGGAAQDNQGGFGPGVQGPYGQAAYGEGSYARGTSSYAFGSNHPYADREAHNRYNREHFAQGNYGATGQRLRGDGPGIAGPHWGKGPKNFMRSDERIREHVSELLMEHGEIDATHLDVQVQNGEVTVIGTVEDRWQRRAIEDLVEGMAGVKDVHISIKVGDRAQGRHAHSQTSEAGRDLTPPNDPKKGKALSCAPKITKTRSGPSRSW